MNKKKQLEDLIEILEKSNIDSLEISSFWGFRKIRLSKGSKNVETNFSSSIPIISKKENATKDVDKSIQEGLDSQNNQELSPVSDSDLFIQKAPLVGTIYLSPKPEDPPFVKEGDIVKKGQKICLIEAMKIFNEIEVEEDGVVHEILVKNEDPVEFGQPIIKIKP